ncbi:uncharacterized protein LOC132804485 [Ziziphus jujuba]|uniref:Uncharacterized protein LOC132804485 n=1 Tax=Ziziphus jujuba TaxID=326968 RepID=A0ABM4ADU2_ZIZJJ|nr:uncharacterized protein LOC132804485 [Ziziphus jujuba]
MIIDSGGYANVISHILVEELGLVTIKHPEPYRLERFNDSGEMEVTKEAKLKFSIDNYMDEVLCDVVHMHTGHILLKRPGQFDKNTIHYGQENSIVFHFKSKKIKLEPLTSIEVFVDQMPMQQKREAERQREKSIIPPMASKWLQEGKAKPNHQANPEELVLPSFISSLLQEFDDVP